MTSIELTAKTWESVWNQQASVVSYNSNDKSMRINRGYISRYIKPSSSRFLEAGCGTARTSLDTALTHRQLDVTCVDITPSALGIAKRLFKENKAEGNFVCADLRAMPFKDGTFDFIFSDGAIEHFEETEKAVSEIHRLLTHGGRTFITVPRISIPMLTIGQFQGNIPKIPHLEWIFEFIHRQVFKSSLMKNGFEYSFTRFQVSKLMTGFHYVDVGLFHGGLISKLCRLELAVKLQSLLCCLIYACGEK